MSEQQEKKKGGFTGMISVSWVQDSSLSESPPSPLIEDGLLINGNLYNKHEYL